ncbi:hypothetical protein HVMH_0810 [Hydrogenovibrio marinus]|nr:hypothetical protein HVMH_0810 [Hydrogenovibrio marinus]
MKAELEVFYLRDSHDHDIDYYYTSRLSSAELAQVVDDIHFHPVEPRTLRFKVSYLFKKLSLI